MTYRWLMGAAALTVAGAVAAQAADLPTRKEAPAPIFVPPPFTWTGFYVGVNAGAVWKSGNNNSSLYAPDAPWLYTYWPNNNNSNTGFIGGGQAGYNWQTGSWVFGVETDFDGSSLSKSRNIVGPNFTNPFTGTTGYLSANGKISLDWLGSTRGRVGFVATPDNRLLIYGTGGVAYGGGTANLNFYDSSTNIYFNSGNNDQSRAGWTLGGGVEYAITNNVILGAEYLYFDLGSKTYYAYPGVINNIPAPYSTVYAREKVNFDGSVVRARLSYKF